MRPDDVLNALRQKPFRPFRLYVLETTAYEIRHPEQILVGNSVIEAYVPNAGAPVPLPVEHAVISLLHVSRIEFLPAAPSGNGE